MISEEIDISKLSPHLFWDVDQKSCEWEKHKLFILERILEYGLIDDWMLIYRNLGIKKIAELASRIKNISPRTLAFLSALAKKPKEEFKCYTTIQSMPRHWNF